MKWKIDTDGKNNLKKKKTVRKWREKLWDFDNYLNTKKKGISFRKFKENVISKNVEKTT